MKEWSKEKLLKVIEGMTPAQCLKLADALEALYGSEPPEEELILNEVEAAERLGISVRQLRELAEAGALESLNEDGEPWPDDLPLPPLPSEH